MLKIINRFRWAFCQLEALRHCLPPSIRFTLNDLPESLDETYERILREISKPNRDHARRLLQCLVVATRPLHVEELTEVLAVDFDDVERIPKLNPNWRWEDEEQALLTSCSSLIAIIKAEDSRVVQFSHFSVKEFLISTRLADSSKDVSRYHIDLEPAHTILALACTGVLLQPGDCVEENGTKKSSPLAQYAAEHMRSSRAYRHFYKRQRNISSTLTSHISRLGLNYTTWTSHTAPGHHPFTGSAELNRHPGLLPYTTLLCADSKILYNI